MQIQGSGLPCLYHHDHSSQGNAQGNDDFGEEAYNCPYAARIGSLAVAVLPGFSEYEMSRLWRLFERVDKKQAKESQGEQTQSQEHAVHKKACLRKERRGRENFFLGEKAGSQRGNYDDGQGDFAHLARIPGFLL